MSNCVTDLHLLESSTQCFPLYLYNEQGQQKSGITDATLNIFKAHYAERADNLSKESIFYYCYAILHSPQYRETFANNLTKELPRIPLAQTWEDFCTFVKAGRELGDLHCDFEAAPIYQAVTIKVHKKGCQTLDDLKADDFRVEKIKYATFKNPQNGKREKDLTQIEYNRYISLRNIPLEAFDYVVNGRPAIDWVVERQGIRIDKASGIVSDSNQYAIETLNNPRYPLELLLRVISVSLITLDIVRTLPTDIAAN